MPPAPSLPVDPAEAARLELVESGPVSNKDRPANWHSVRLLFFPFRTDSHRLFPVLALQAPEKTLRSRCTRQTSLFTLLSVPF